ncbi:hypothetical protein C7C46_19270 [Streptomyces tateyamensis]|uniref:Peptidase S9 prolyl oligopeptidase catalytic domain-containing protein n=1 Tax=Streptomyces tateyamensis TaxID=565073 RepID=A0A2V4NDN7_9ACTN|nr:alpha/beta fold hydrolase [Streptomyces tateyamensis]PYC77287.1 hypothetical protein C7C46_19270 [Streptomyces tateyamensis]
MNTALRTAVVRRVSFAFAADGSYGACLAAGPDGGWGVERWRLTGEPTAVVLGDAPAEGLRSQLVPLPDGRVLLLRHEGERHDLALLDESGERPLATLHQPGLRLLALPGRPAPGAPVAVALGTDTSPATRAWLVHADGRPPTQVAELAGLHGGGTWLDRTGRLLALERVHAGQVRTVVLDLRLGSATWMFDLAPDSNDRLVLFDPDTRFLLLRSDAPGEDRLGWGVLGGPEPVRFPDCLHQGGRFLRPVALEPGAAEAAATRVVLLGEHGAGSALSLWRPTAGRLTALAAPPGRFGAVGHWSAAGLRVPYSAPDRPTGLATLTVGQSATDLAWRLDGSAPPPPGTAWHGARAVQLAGPAGPIEAVAYGGEDWLTSPRLVLALHGGPADAWRLEFDPLLQRFAAEGLAVLAPNQRGSVGYGTRHALAIRGAWGGPDLADVLALLARIADRRGALGLPPPALFGVSYGAFLALLATALAPPGLLGRCAAVAPFLSGARLLADGAPAVRALVGRLGGAVPVTDPYGPRDLAVLAGRLAAPLLLLHGDQDRIVPVAHSRTLRQELLRHGRTEGTDFHYLEPAGAGHELLAEPGSAVLHELLAGFLRATA